MGKNANMTFTYADNVFVYYGSLIYIMQHHEYQEEDQSPQKEEPEPEEPQANETQAEEVLNEEEPLEKEEIEPMEEEAELPPLISTDDLVVCFGYLVMVCMFLMSV